MKTVGRSSSISKATATSPTMTPTDRLRRPARRHARGNVRRQRVRVDAGYEPIELVGWATPPRYDSRTHKLYWAKELKFGDSDENTLNYNIRILGRRGVLVLNAVAGMSQLALVQSGMQRGAGHHRFQPGPPLCRLRSQSGPGRRVRHRRTGGRRPGGQSRTVRQAGRAVAGG